MIFVRVNVSEATPDELNAVEVHLQALRGIAGVGVQIEGDNELHDTVRNKYLDIFAERRMRAGDVFNQRDIAQSAIRADFDPLEQDAALSVLQAMTDQGMLEFDEARKLLILTKAGEKETYRTDR